MSYTDDDGVTTSKTSTAVTVGDAPPTVTVTGTATEGQTLTAVPVTSADATVTFQWQSSTTGASWSNISGAKSSTYVVQEADETRLLRVVATAADLDGGGGIAKSAPTLAVKDADPTVTKPTIVGTTQEGQVLTASASAGQGDNPVTYQWLSSASGYKVAIGAGSTYKLKEADEGFTVEAVATAKNGDGLTVSQTCNATATVFDAAPTVSLPKISGTAQEGKTLTASATAGQADNPVTYQWFSSASAVAIGSGSTYKVQEGDEGHTIEVVATVTNEQSLTVSATSAATSSVIDAAPTVTTPIVTGTAHIGSTLTASATSGEPGEEGVSYQWMENNGSGGTYQNIPNATGQTYAPQEGDEGFRLEVVATVTNDDGTVVSKTSAPTGVVTETEPAPTFTITTSPLTLPKGGSVLLPISNVAGFDADDNVQVTVGGIASYESIVAASDGKTSSGSSFTFSAAEVNSGLTLNSFYTGTAKPVNTLSFVAKNTAAGETSASVAKTIKVTDPPPASSSATTPNIALLGSDMAGAFATSGGGQGGTLISEFRSSLLH